MRNSTDSYLINCFFKKYMFLFVICSCDLIVTSLFSDSPQPVSSYLPNSVSITCLATPTDSTTATVFQKAVLNAQSHQQCCYCLLSSVIAIKTEQERETLHYSTLLLQTSKNVRQDVVLYSKQKQTSKRQSEISHSSENSAIHTHK